MVQNLLYLYLNFLISFDGIYGGLDTTKSYLPILYLFKSKTLNLLRFDKLSLLRIYFCIWIAFEEISIPVPLERFNSFNTDKQYAAWACSNI